MAFPPHLPSKAKFLAAHKLTEAAFTASKYKWEELREIYEEYSNANLQLNLTVEGEGCLRKLQAHPKVRAVYSRPKDPEHLIAKLIRKSAKIKKRYATKANYLTTLTDLVGVRALLIFKEDWEELHPYIMSTLKVRGKPEAKISQADGPDIAKMYKTHCDVTINPEGYRSIHYCVIVNCNNMEIMAELQVRTLFEEAWGETSHKIDYPIPTTSPLLRSFVEGLGHAAGASDAVASAARALIEFDAIKGKKSAKRQAELSAIAVHKMREYARMSKLADPPAMWDCDLQPEAQMKMLKIYGDAPRSKKKR